MNASCQYETCELTLGDLIVAVTEAALEATGDEEKANEIAGRVLVRLLADSAPEALEQLIAASGERVLH